MGQPFAASSWVVVPRFVHDDPQIQQAYVNAHIQAAILSFRAIETPKPKTDKALISWELRAKLRGMRAAKVQDVQEAS